jgi:hypothetical protein
VKANLSRGIIVKRILFVLKYRESSGGNYSNCWSEQDKAAVAVKRELSSGLLNSARFVVEMLKQSDVDVRLAQVTDNNAIDREVSIYKPDVVIIEALWVVPTKFAVLQRLHPNVIWVVRGHSELPFLAQEGVAMKWINEYVHYDNVMFAANSERSAKDIRTIVKAANPAWSSSKVIEKVPLLPNYYPYDLKLPSNKAKKKDSEFIDIACFGAIRPLKNQLLQSVAALEYAGIIGKTLRFHTNATRIETQGDPVLRNLDNLFEATSHQLIKHPWMPHDEFLSLLTQMDVGMQCSYSESFNIIAADMVVSKLPMVVSPAISWATGWCQADPNDCDDIVVNLIKTQDWRLRGAIRVLNYRGLKHYCETSKAIWLSFITQ